jgi:chromosome segregation ATPase
VTDHIDPPNATVLPLSEREEPEWQCPGCPAWYADSGDLAAHIEELHPEVAEIAGLRSRLKFALHDAETCAHERDQARAALTQTQQDLAASQADLTRVEQERDWERQVVAMLRKNGVTSARVIRERNAERNLLRAELASARAELDLLRPRLDVAELELHKARMTLRAVAAEPGWQDVSPPKDSPPIPAGDTNKEIQ